VSHPEIGSLVRAKDEMWSRLRQEDYIGALRMMRAILSDIRQDDVPDDLFDKIMKEENQAQGTESSKQYRRHLTSSAHTYWKWAREIVQILWKPKSGKSYLYDKSYGVEARRDTTFKNTKPWTEE